MVWYLGHGVVDDEDEESRSGYLPKMGGSNGGREEKTVKQPPSRYTPCDAVEDQKIYYIAPCVHAG